MKNILILLLLVPLLFACNDGNKTSDPQAVSEQEVSDSSATSSQDPEERALAETATEKDGIPSDSASTASRNTTPPGLEGEYRRVDSEGNSGPCACSCLEVSFENPTELCISPDNIYILGRFEKTGTGSANVYFVEEVQSDALADDIPWQDFDTDIPIATISVQPDNSLKLDWKSFSIDGEVAVDYAIYGKKTLEGNYLKQ